MTSEAPGPRPRDPPAWHLQPPSSTGGLPTDTVAHAPSAQRPLVHWTSKPHGWPSAPDAAGPHVPSAPATLRSARQRSLGEQARSQQIPSSQCPLVHSSPRVQGAGAQPVRLA
jgi:hypothetical protein